MRPLVIVGASGFGREALDAVRAMSEARLGEAFDVAGFVDDAPSPLNLERLGALGVAYLGGLEALFADRDPGEYVLGIGAPAVRERLVARLDAAGWRAPVIVHPSATVGSLPQLGDGVVVCAGAQISTNVRLGRHVHVNPNATLGHDADLRPFVSINPGAIISGEVVVGERTLIGAGAIVLQGLSVGADTIVGAGSVVTKDVPDGVVVKGVPGVWA